ncbi:hypothetical protein G3I58_01195, partial [Streptomyces anulatus]|nr:hypothetical protein [Streptomyces anulatus]
MGRSGRLPGPLKGRTAEANALAQFLRDLTAQDTVSQLEQRYKLSRSVWSEYRSGMKTIPLPRLNRIIEDRFPRDARTRSAKLQEARRLHAAAVAAPLPPPPHTTPTPDTTPAPVPAPGGRSPDHDQAPEPMPEPVSEPAPIVRDDTAGLSADNPVTSENAAPKRTERPGRWRAPAQWAALAALVAALILANQMQGSNDRPSAASPLNVPEQGLQSAMPATPTTSPTGPMAPVEERPAPPQSSAPAEPAKRAPEKSRPRAGGAGIVAATTDRLYRITADAQVEEYTGKAGVWTVIRKRTERIFTSATTLYATDIGTGDIEEYDRTKKTWTVIGGPGLHFAATSTHLYGVGTLGTMEYSGTPKVWHHVRGATERIFTNATTLYATDAKTGDIEEYDRT